MVMQRWFTKNCKQPQSESSHLPKRKRNITIFFLPSKNKQVNQSEGKTTNTKNHKLFYEMRRLVRRIKLPIQELDVTSLIKTTESA